MKTKIILAVLSYTIMGITGCSKNTTQQQPPPPPPPLIIYTDVKPDRTTNTYNLDLNNDDTTDFIITNYDAVFQCNSTCTHSTINNHFNVSPAGIYLVNQIIDVPA